MLARWRYNHDYDGGADIKHYVIKYHDDNVEYVARVYDDSDFILVYDIDNEHVAFHHILDDDDDVS